MTTQQQAGARPAVFVPGPNAAIVRYQIQDVERAVAFYTQRLGFALTQRSGPITVLSRGDLHLLLSGPGSSGARPMPDGRRQESGGWNRIVVYVDSLDATIAALQTAGARFRNDIETGPGGRQILVDDPDGNPVELHEPPKR
ncbi:MAG TPA: VOC family protein [Kofleriaceae bacterium]|nr:VOC family protein [Kofleriaceae bacterium]